MKKLILTVAILTLILSACYYRDSMDMAYDAYVDKRNNCTSEACRQVAAQEFAGQADNIANNWEKWQPPNQMKSTPAVETKQEVEFNPSAEPFTPEMPISTIEESKDKKMQQCGESDAPFKSEEGCIDEEARKFVEEKNKKEKEDQDIP